MTCCELVVEIRRKAHVAQAFFVEDTDVGIEGRVLLLLREK